MKPPCNKWSVHKVNNTPQETLWWRCMKFTHLEAVQQTYLEHLSDAWSYSLESIMAAFYFFLHGLCPDMFVNNGSETIARINTTIEVKVKNMQWM